MDINRHRYCVIMCGGIGSRFWPYSRTNLPKQFIDFLGTGRSLLQMSYDRILPIVPKENIIVVTNAQYAALVKEQLPEALRSPYLVRSRPPQYSTLHRLGCISYPCHRPYGIDYRVAIGSPHHSRTPIRGQHHQRLRICRAKRCTAHPRHPPHPT